MTDRQEPKRTGSGWTVALFAIPVLCCAGPALLAALGAGSVGALARRSDRQRRPRDRRPGRRLSCRGGDRAASHAPMIRKVSSGTGETMTA